MIMTQYGTPIERVLSVDEKTGMATVEVLTGKRTRHGAWKVENRDYALHQLRADGGIQEILAAAERRLS